MAAALAVGASACSSAGIDDGGPQLTTAPVPGEDSATSTGALDPTTGGLGGSEAATLAATTGDGSATTMAADGETEAPIFDVGPPPGGDLRRTLGEMVEAQMARAGS